MQGPNDQLLTTKEAAEILRVHPVTLRVARSKRARGTIRLPTVRIGGRVLYLLADVLAYIEANRSEGAV